MCASPVSLSTCQYLFNKSAQELFPKEDPVFVDQSLQTMMKVIDYIAANHPEALFILTPAAFNNQCHLYSLFLAQILNQDKVQKAATAVLSQEPKPVGEVASAGAPMKTPDAVDRRFLYHMFSLSFAFLIDRDLIDNLVCKTLKEMNEPIPTKQFRAFIKDSDSLRMYASRAAIVSLFKEHMKRTCAEGKGPLYRELAEIANENLELAASVGKGTPYTFPKYAGVAYLVDQMAKEKIPFCFKTKVITKDGVGSFSVSSENLKTLEPATPVIVFEAVIPGDSLTFPDCMSAAKRCNDYVDHNPSSKNRHSKGDSCLFCSPDQIDIAPFQQEFVGLIAEKTNDMLFALGADFLCNAQPAFRPLFANEARFPILAKGFQGSLLDIGKYHLSRVKPKNLTMEHVYIDCAAKAADPSLVMDKSYRTHMQSRGLI